MAQVTLDTLVDGMTILRNRGQTSRASHLNRCQQTKMASSEGVPQLGGHDYEFVREVPDKWICLICQLTLKDPMQIEGCGHRLCKICIDQIMR